MDKRRSEVWLAFRPRSGSQLRGTRLADLDWPIVQPPLQHGKASLLRFPQQQAEGHEPDQDSSKPSLYLHSDITVPNDTHRHEIPLQVYFIAQRE
jgi:hypothetical protein